MAVGPLLLALGGCVLAGIEPDEIDVADESETGASNDTGQGTDDFGDGDGDGDATTTGDGDGDPTGDGDGDGDGDPNLAPCSDFRPQPLTDGDNPIEVLVGTNQFSGTCGGLEGPEAIFSYTATVEGLHSFALDAEFDAVVYLVGEQCVPLDEWVCDPASVETLLTVDQTVYVIVDSNLADVGGTATLTISGP